VPDLQGKYLYADYVSGLIWALDYDPESGEVTNYSIPAPSGQYAVISFGEDQQGEAYFTVVSPTGKGIFRLVAADE
jgi:quinoprotein glucose dehydrogenase